MASHGRGPDGKKHDMSIMRGLVLLLKSSKCGPVDDPYVDVSHNEHDYLDVNVNHNVFISPFVDLSHNVYHFLYVDMNHNVVFSNYFVC